jgi:hypothetical protein
MFFLFVEYNLIFLIYASIYGGIYCSGKYSIYDESCAFSDIFVSMYGHDISDIHMMNLFSSVMPLMLKGLISCPLRATI